MPSPRQLAANRSNAQHSTGPRSVQGKAQSRLNVFRHGLSTPASAISALAPTIAELARRLAGADEADPAIWAATIRVAEATVDMMRVRLARTALLDRMARSPDFLQAIPAAEPVPAHRPHYKSSSPDMRMQAIRNGTYDEMVSSDLTRLKEYLDYAAEMQRVKQHNEVVTRKTKQYRSDWDCLDKLDRYERRALSRRNTAIRILGEMQAAARNMEQQ